MYFTFLLKRVFLHHGELFQNDTFHMNNLLNVIVNIETFKPVVFPSIYF